MAYQQHPMSGNYYQNQYHPALQNQGWAQQKYHQLLYQMDSELQYHSFLVNMANSWHMRVGEFVLYSFGLFCLIIIILFGPNSLAHFVGFPYPFLASLAALESPTTRDDTQWLTYWIVYGLFTVVESFTDFFVGWIPFYFIVKLLFLVFCFLPSTRGADKIYKYMIRPFMYDRAAATQYGGWRAWF